MPRARLNSLSAPKKTKKLVASVKDGWSRDVVCPSCGAPAKRADAEPYWRCTMEICAFQLGWVLRPTSEIERTFTKILRGEQTETKVVVKRIVAVPVDEDGNETWALLVNWPKDPPIAKLLDEDESLVAA